MDLSPFFNHCGSRAIDDNTTPAQQRACIEILLLSSIQSFNRESMLDKLADLRDHFTRKARALQGCEEKEEILAGLQAVAQEFDDLFTYLEKQSGTEVARP